MPVGSLLAALLAILLLDQIGWRGMFWIGALPLVTLLPLAFLKMPESVGAEQGPGHRPAGRSPHDTTPAAAVGPGVVRHEAVDEGLGAAGAWAPHGRPRGPGQRTEHLTAVEHPRKVLCNLPGSERHVGACVTWFRRGFWVFDDDHLVSCAGLVPVMTLAEQTGLLRLLDQMVDIKVPRTAAGVANPAPKLATVVAGMCAGADCIDDIDVVHSGDEDALWRGVCALDGTWSVSRRFRTFLQLHGQPRRLRLDD